MASWSIPAGKVSAKTKEALDTTVRRAIIRLFYKVVLPSPVDTGRFRANWNVAYGTPDLTTSTSTAAGRVRAQVESVNKAPLTGLIYLTNNLAYAITLEYGSSAQAPAGMVRIAVASWPQILKRSVKG